MSKTYFPRIATYLKCGRVFLNKGEGGSEVVPKQNKLSDFAFKNQ